MLKTFITAAAGAVLLAAAPVAAEAAPVLYNVEFDGTVAGDPGTGSFLYDADTGTMTDFTWDFGSGRTGGVLDSILAVDLGSLSAGQYLFETMTGTPSPGTIGSTFGLIPRSLSGPFPDASAEFCWGSNNSLCGLPDGSASSYDFRDGTALFQGVLTVSRATAVPEPATLALLGVGLAGLGLIRRARA